MSMLMMLKEGGSLLIDSIGGPIDEDVDLIEFGDLKFILFDSTQDNIDGSTGELKFILSDTTQDNIALSGNKLKFIDYTGTQDDIDLVNFIRN